MGRTRRVSIAWASVIALLACLFTGLGWTKAEQGVLQPIIIFAGQSQLLSTPWPTKRLSITDPKTADVEAISPRQILLLGRKVGSTDLVIWSDGGEVVQHRVDVREDLERLERELKKSLPKASLAVSQSAEVVVITGTVPDQDQRKQLEKFLLAAQKATGVEHVNMTQVEVIPRQPDLSDAALTPAMLHDELARLFPDGQLEVRQTGEVMIVSGSLRRSEQVEQLSKLLAAFEGKGEQRIATPSNNRETATSQPSVAGSGTIPSIRFLNLTTLAGPQQVQLKVKVAEVSRTAIRALGINALQSGHHDGTFFGASVIGPDGGGALNPINIGPPAGAIAGTENTLMTFNSDVNVSPLVTTFFGFPRAELEFFLQALAENQYLRLLAEPTLVALSGEEANFLAGGEFPIPVVQGGTIGAVSVTIEYKEFGVRLRFRPTVLGDGTIRLHVAPEVSDLTDSGAVVIQGFRVPALMTRRAETTLEIHSGQTFSMAGLLNDRNEGRSSRVPALGDVPVLGALFRSTRYVKGETELVVLVTASLVEPLSTAQPPPVPGVLDVAPNDWELYMEGTVEGRGQPELSDSDARWLGHMGFEGLRGPGAWEDYQVTVEQK